MVDVLEKKVKGGEVAREFVKKCGWEARLYIFKVWEYHLRRRSLPISCCIYTQATCLI
jgi:hypothetical protein